MKKNTPYLPCNWAKTHLICHSIGQKTHLICYLIEHSGSRESSLSDILPRIQSIQVLKSVGAGTHPWQTPVITGNKKKSNRRLQTLARISFEWCIFFFKGFYSIQYGCQTMWPINYSWTPWYPECLGNICVKFPLDLSSRSRRLF